MQCFTYPVSIPLIFFCRRNTWVFISRRVVFVLMIFICLLQCSKVLSQSFGPRFYFDEEYAQQVKQIDEFMDRFNNQIKVYDRGELQQYSGTEDERAVLLRSLFNQKDTAWNIVEVQSFIEDVNHPAYPFYLNFYDEGWFAEVDCKVNYKGVIKPMKLTMKIEVNKKYAAKWVISGVEAPFLQIKEPEDQTASINPSNHNIRFSRLDEALEDKRNLRNYISKNFELDELTLFYDALMRDEILMQRVDNIRYHFLQAAGWIIIVDQFKRPSKNSGWLISQLIRANYIDKLNYQNQVLNIR